MSFLREINLYLDNIRDKMLESKMSDINALSIFGAKAILTSYSPEYTIYVVFEDDGDTGYFYAVERTDKEDVILDALHIYNVGSNDSFSVNIKWSSDNLEALLMINNITHAIFNFKSEVGYCINYFAAVNKYTGKWKRMRINELHEPCGCIN